MAVTAANPPDDNALRAPPRDPQIRLSDRQALQTALSEPQPVLVHVNADTTWLLSLAYPEGAQRPAGRARFNILLDPWLRGPQSDVASWFSTQWHVVAPSVETTADLDALLAEVEGGILDEEGGGRPDTTTAAAQQQQQSSGAKRSHIDVVAVSHEFTDHCHEATLKELPRSTPVFATEKAAALIGSWKHFDRVITTPGFSSSSARDWKKALSVAPLPSWVGIGRAVTPGNALYYHSAVLVLFDNAAAAAAAAEAEPTDSGAGAAAASAASAVVYTPHGIQGSDLEPLTAAAGVDVLALLHGLHDVRIWMTKQLNLGAVNGLRAVRASGARYWVATHDEVKKGGGFISPLLRRTRYTLADAVRKESKRAGEKAPRYEFVELGSGDALVLA